MRLNAYSSSKLYKERTKKYHDKRIVERNFHPDQSMLLFNSRLRIFPGKLKSRWSGPYVVKEVKPYGAIMLKDPESQECWVVNGQRVNPYLGTE